MGMTALPLAAEVTLCGYCERPLVLQPEGDWACDRCRPLLTEVHTAEDWARFHVDARNS